MDRPIQVGDLVEIVKPFDCCSSISDLGTIHRVGKIGPASWLCKFCRAKGEKNLYAWNDEGHSISGLNRLKRIPPLSELEGQKTEEDLKEKV